MKMRPRRYLSLKRKHKYLLKCFCILLVIPLIVNTSIYNQWLYNDNNDMNFF